MIAMFAMNGPWEWIIILVVVLIVLYEHFQGFQHNQQFLVVGALAH